MSPALRLIVLALAGCATPSLVTGPGPLQPLVVGTERHQSPYTFDRIRGLVDALGPDGEVLGQRVVWSPGLLGGWGKLYFEARRRAPQWITP